jgi:hypothetical protein
MAILLSDEVILSNFEVLDPFYLVHFRVDFSHLKTKIRIRFTSLARIQLPIFN